MERQDVRWFCWETSTPIDSDGTWWSSRTWRCLDHSSVGRISARHRVRAGAGAVDSTAKGKLIDAFREFLHAERGLSTATLANYLRIVRRFLDEEFGDKAPDFDRLRVGDVHRFVCAASSGRVARPR
ncbi:site-specific integrase [Mesorhizobium sp.]|uniref:site-specific integrase n=1 Tax=Mesorhizobium sp. TaxID=1871066 RepID=UPI0034449724